MLNAAKKFRLSCKNEYGAPKSLFVFCLLITGLFCLTAATNTVNAATYYLDANNGNDTNPGTSAAPWKTLNKAQSIVAEGDTVLLRSGNYGAFVDETSARTNWITYKADNGHEPNFTYIRVGQWTGPYNLYLRFEGIRISPGDTSRRGVNIVYANYVKFVDVTLIGTSKYTVSDGSAAFYIRDSNHIEINGCTVNASSIEPDMGFEYGVLAGNASFNFKVLNCDMQRGRVGISAQGADWLIKGNHVHNTDSDGLWLVNLAYSTIENNHIEAIGPREPYFTSSSDCSYDDSTKTITANQGNLWAQVNIETAAYKEYVRITPQGQSPTDWYYVDSNTANTLTLVKAIGQDYPNISLIELRHSYHADGIQAFNTPASDTSSPAFRYIEHLTITGNRIHDIVHQGIFFNVDLGSKYITVENNLISVMNSLMMAEGTGVAVSFNGTQHLRFNNNTVPGNHGSNWSVDTTGKVYVRIQSIPEPDIISSIDEFANNIIDLLDIDVDSGGVGDINYANNNILNTCWVGMDTYNRGSNTLYFNSNLTGFKTLFADYDNRDFALGAGSAAIDFANPTYALPTDILGNSRVGTPDAGCYEYTASDPNNSAPVVDAIGNKSVNENSLLTFDVNATDADGDTITYSAQNLPSGATFSSPFSWTPGYSQAGSYQVTFIASDGSTQDSETITITVNNVNRAPVLAAIGNKSVNEGSLLSFSVSATDADGDTITYSAQNLPTGATFSNRTFSWTPSYSQAGSFEVTFIASDGQEQDPETITVTVGNTNRAPVLTAIGNKTVNENTTLNFSVSATDADGNPITYSVEDLPSGAAFASQSFIWTPGYDQAGTFEVTFNASDGQDQDSETITTTVSNVNRAPVLDAIADKSVDDGTLLTFAVNATDPDGDTIEYSATSLPSGAAFAGQTFNWTPAYSQADNSYQVTFIAGDGQLQDSQVINIVISDTSSPAVTNRSPAAGSIQTPLNSLIILHVTDAGEGVDNSSVTIAVDDSIVYTGNTNHYARSTGDCRRSGTESDYTFIYQPDEMLDFDQTVSVTVNATDLAGNPMPEHSYSFKTEMRSFGENKKVSSLDIGKGAPGTVRDSSGNIWAAWHAGPIDNRDIYIGKLAAGAEHFESTVQLTTDATDQCNPAVALDSNDTLYVVWQDNREGDWDTYVSTSVDGISWSTETRVNDPNNDNQVNPAIVIDGQSPNQAHVVWQDDRAGNQDVCIATSSDGFVTTTVSQITSDSSDQVEPDITADSANTIYVVWTDGRNSSNDIYGAASNNSWMNVQIVSNANNQSSPTIAAESTDSILHLLWVDDTSGDLDIYYAISDGLPASPLNGSSIVDDTSAADQWAPAIVTTGSTGNNLRVFACWQDWRNTDADLYFAELSAGSGTNVFVGDGGSSAYQGEPVMGIDEYSHPYLVWADSRNTDIYYAGSTYIEPVPLISQLAPFSKGAVYGLPVGQLRKPGDICMQIPAGAYPHEIRLKASRIKNAQRFASGQSKVPYEFGPSGIDFNAPITITIAYLPPTSSPVSVYWHDPMTGTLKQDGITNVTIIERSEDLHLVRFKVRHFTSFYLLGGAAAIGGGGGGGGGCSVSSTGRGNIVEFLVPYIGLAAAMVIIRLWDMRNRKARNIKRGELQK